MHIFISFQKIYTFARLFSTDFVLLYIFCLGTSKLSLWSKTICAPKVSKILVIWLVSGGFRVVSADFSWFQVGLCLSMFAKWKLSLVHPKKKRKAK